MERRGIGLNFRDATESDLLILIEMLAEDPLGAKRELVSEPIDQRYLDSFQHINRDINNELIVVEYAGEVVGMLQLTFIPYLTHVGSWRCLIEGVRIHIDFRGKGFGKHVIRWAIQRAQDRRCEIVQLTSDKQRPDAIRFYQSMGFDATHEGFKLLLGNSTP
ncbi:MAG: GNAT family N-acetyltransferase [Acidiferrobacterales bacterium]|nr:GNAT family N-acetyltransferase [Acidiferrobacterales bacterium]